jgi:hypothetical protein
VQPGWAGAPVKGADPSNVVSPEWHISVVSPERCPQKGMVPLVFDTWKNLIPWLSKLAELHDLIGIAS